MTNGKVLEEFADGVARGSHFGGAPPGLEGRVRVHFEKKPTPGGSLELRLSRRSKGATAAWFVSLLSLGAVGYAWWSVGGIAPHFSLYIVSAFVLLMVYGGTKTVFDRCVVELRDGKFEVRAGFPRLSILMTRDAEGIQQAIPRAQGVSANLVLQTSEGTTTVLPKLPSPDLAYYLAAQVNACLGLPHFSTRKESGQFGIASRKRPVFVTVLLLIGLGATAVVIPQKCGAALGEMTVNEEPNSITVRMPSQGRMAFSALVELTELHRDLPDSILYHIEVRGQDGASRTLECDPADQFAWVTSGHNQRWRSTEGRLNNCSVVLPAGSYAVTARRTWIEGRKRVGLESTTLAPRFEPAP